MSHRVGVAVVLTAAIWFPAGTAVASTASTCTFDEAIGRVEISLTGNANVLFRSGDEIELNGGAACTGSTVFNTDTIVVTGDGTTPDGTAVAMLIDMTGGRFAPGLTDEGPASEIEIDVRFAAHSPNQLSIYANTGGQRIAVRGHRIDLDADAIDADADVLVTGIGNCDGTQCFFLSVSTGAGADRIDHRAHPNDQGALAFIAGGPGRDVMDSRSSAGTGTFVDGRAGDDILRSSAGSQVAGGRGDDLLVSTGGRAFLLGQRGSDRIFGRDRGDYLDGGNGPDEIVGDRGADTLRGGRGADRLWGGPGPDESRGDEGFDRCEPEREWTLREQSCERRLLVPPPHP